MKKILSIFLILILFIGISFGIRPVTKEENNSFMKSLGISEEGIIKLEKIENNYSRNLNKAIKKSRKYQTDNPGMNIKMYTDYTNNLINKVYKNYEKELGKVLTPNQKKRYLEYNTRVY